MTPAQRKQKAKQLAGLIEQLDIAHLVRNRLALQCLDASDPIKVQAVADAAIEALQTINSVANEGKLDYAGSKHKLGESAK